METTPSDSALRAARARKASPFLSSKEAAFYLGLKAGTLAKMRMQKRGPTHRKHGRHIFYHIDDLDAWSRGPSQ